MDNVRFDEQGPRPHRVAPIAPRGLIGFLIRQGIVRDIHGAQKFLLIALVVIVLATIGVYTLGGGISGGDAQPLPEDLIG